MIDKVGLRDFCALIAGDFECRPPGVGDENGFYPVDESPFSESGFRYAICLGSLIFRFCLSAAPRL